MDFVDKQTKQKNHSRRATNEIQVFVETLDKCFESVCELDIIFHSDKVHFILDEIVLGGLVLETNLSDILLAINENTRLEKSSLGEPERGVNIAKTSPFTFLKR